MVLITKTHQQAPPGKVFIKSYGGESLTRKSLYEGKLSKAGIRSQSLPTEKTTMAKLRPYQTHGLFPDPPKPSFLDNKKHGEWDWVDSYRKQQNRLVPGAVKTSYKIQWNYRGPDFEEKEAVKGKLDSILKSDFSGQWYPRDQLQVSLPRTNLYQQDPINLDQPQTHVADNYFGCGVAPDRVLHDRYDKWSNEEKWKDAKNHATLKITSCPHATRSSNNFNPHASDGYAPGCVSPNHRQRFLEKGIVLQD